MGCCCQIRVVKDPRFSTVNGAAMLAAVGMGKLKFTDLNDLSAPTEDHLPDEGESSIYESEFQRFIAYYKNNKRISGRSHPA